MKLSKRAWITIALAVMGLTANAAIAHGDEPHDQASGDHAAALGRPGDAGHVTRTIDVDMNDSMRFVPASIEVRRGETVRFRVKNSGQAKHEMVLGTLDELKEHAALMQKFPEMEHADPNQASVEPGRMGELIWQFTKVGKFYFACLQPGHFEAGMRGQLVVKP